MEIFIKIATDTHGYTLTLPALPAFHLSAPTIDEALAALPENLKSFCLDWERQNQRTDNHYLAQFPYVQRIKSRGFYQSTTHRFQDVYALNPVEQLDLELIHRLQRKEYETFLKSLHS